MSTEREIKPIIPSYQMSAEERLKNAQAFWEQHLYARALGWKNIPKDRECYHGNNIYECPSRNCAVDSGRVSQQNVRDFRKQTKSSALDAGF